ncbi:unnamed protein product, partial [Effrenium voratum]
LSALAPAARTADRVGIPGAKKREPKAMAPRRSPLALALLAFALLASRAFVGLPQVAELPQTEALQGVMTQAPELGSSVALADLSPLENPNITFVVLLSMFSMSIAMVVWGRNGF